jgi:hypothetical protein
MGNLVTLIVKYLAKRQAFHDEARLKECLSLWPQREQYLVSGLEIAFQTGP